MPTFLSDPAPAFYLVLFGFVVVTGAIAARNQDRKSLLRFAAALAVLLIVFLIDFYLRTTSGGRWIGGSLTIPLLLSVLGIVLITISGWLGGEMVYVHGVAVEPGRNAETPERLRS